MNNQNDRDLLNSSERGDLAGFMIGAAQRDLYDVCHKKGGNLDVLLAAIAAGADVNRPDYTGRTPLQLACAFDHPLIVLALIEAGADIEAKNAPRRTTPLYDAASFGNRACVSILLQAGAVTDHCVINRLPLQAHAQQRGWHDVIAAIEQRALNGFIKKANDKKQEQGLGL